MKNKSVEEHLPKIARFRRKLREVMRQTAVCRGGSEGAPGSDKGEAQSQPARIPCLDASS